MVFGADVGDEGVEAGGDLGGGSVGDGEEGGWFVERRGRDEGKGGGGERGFRRDG